MNRLIADLGERARVACPVTRVERRDDGVELVFDDGQRCVRRGGAGLPQ